MTEPNLPQSAAPSPLQQMVGLQFAWQQLFWRMQMSVFSGAWLAGRPAPVVAEAKLPADQHGQLAIPPAVAAEGEHGLFA